MIVKVNSKNVNDYKKLFNIASKILMVYSKYEETTDIEQDYIVDALKNYTKKTDATIKDILKYTFDLDDFMRYIHDNPNQLCPDLYDDILDNLLVQNIEDYFLVLNNLVDCVSKNSGDDDLKDTPYADWKYFTLIPLPGEASFDKEPTIKINANTRAITVPSELKTFGVVGDNLAEIVYFEIDRFFDTIDFGDPSIHPEVKWYDLDGEEHRTEIFLTELSLIPGKVLLGWPITKNMTTSENGTGGTIEFALRFYSTKESTGEITYNFTTLSAKANIAKTLNFDNIEIDKDEASDLILHRITHQQSPTTSQGAEVIAPTWERNVDEIAQVEFDEAEGKYKYNIISKELANKNGYYIDFPDDTHTLDLTDLSHYDASEEHNDKYVAPYAKDKESGNGQILYSWYKYDDISGWQILSNNKASSSDITITNNGKYMLKATNYISAKREKTIESKYLYILDAEKPLVATLKSDAVDYNSAYIGKNTIEVLPQSGVAGKWYTDVNENNDTNKVNTTFQWYYSETKDGEYTIEADANKQSFSPVKEGYYKGFAYGTRNYQTKPSESENYSFYRVTESIKPLETNYYSLTYNNASGYENDRSVNFNKNANSDITISLDKEEKYKFDSIDYRWTRSTNSDFTDESNIDLVKSSLKNTDSEWKITLPANIIQEQAVATYYKLYIKVHRNNEESQEYNLFENNKDAKAIIVMN